MPGTNWWSPLTDTLAGMFTPSPAYGNTPAQVAAITAQRNALGNFANKQDAINWLDVASPTDLQTLGFSDFNAAKTFITVSDVAHINDRFTPAGVKTAAYNAAEMAKPQWQQQLDGFLNTNPVGQAIAPVLANGSHVTVDGSGNATAGAGMRGGLPGPGPYDAGAKVDNALAANPNPTGVNFQTPQNQGTFSGFTPSVGSGVTQNSNPNFIGPPAPVTSATVTPDGHGGWVVPLGHSLAVMSDGSPMPPGSHYPGQPVPENLGGPHVAPAAVTAGNPGMPVPAGGLTKAQYDSQVAILKNAYQHDLSISPAQLDKNIAALGNDPGNNANNPTTTTTNPNNAPAASAVNGAAGAAGVAGAAASGTGNAFVDGVIKNAGVIAPLAGAVVSGVTGAIGAKSIADAANAGVQLQRDQFDYQKQIQAPYLNPTTGAGPLALKALQDQTAANHQFTMADYQTDPGAAFRLSEGLKALDNSASARGGVLSGNALKGVNDYAQNTASQEYGNAFNRYMAQRGAQTNTLQSLAGMGQTATQQVGQASQNFATQASQGLQTAGNAGAAGWLGAGNALNNGLTSASAYNQGNSLVTALQNLAGKGS
jgi:hypothetical protein